MGKTFQSKRSTKTMTRYFLLLISCILLTGSLTFGAETNDGLQIAPLNPQLLIGKSRDLPPQTDNSGMMIQLAPSKGANPRITGYRPPLFDTTMPENYMTESDQKFFSNLSLPASYDLRKTDKVTPVKAQGNSGSCWTFSTYGSMESCLLPTENRDFSENNLKNTHGFDRGQSEGGNFEMAMAYLTRWSGPINEVDDPYDDSSGDSPASSTLTVQKHIQEVLHFPDRSNEQIKNAIMKYGGVSTAMCWDPKINTNYRTYNTYNETTHAYWDFISDDYRYYTGLNHAVTIVGWNDNYSRSNFKSCPGISSQTATYPAGPPAGNGAWIVKNSWGTDWGEAGYFYVSYYDNNFAHDVFVFANAEPVDNYQHRYDYDPFGNVENIGYGSPTAWMANIFTAVTGDGLTAVGTYAETANATYTIQIYTGVSANATSPKNGKLVHTQAGTFTKAGYHTVTLSSPIQLTAGEKFSVVFKITTPNYNYPVPVEARVAGVDSPLFDYTTDAVSNPGESYMSKDGASWQDMYYRREVVRDRYKDPVILIDNFNACIKAYTTNRPIVTTQPTSQTVDAETNPTFTVDAFSTSQASYQWYYNDMPIPGATLATLSLNNVSPDNDGEYYVAVTNDWGSKTSNKATLTVRPLLPEPILDLKPGTYASFQNVSVFYPDGYAGVTFRYTTNGTDPTATSPVFSPTTPLPITKNTTLKVRAFLTGYTSSHVTIAIYTITGTVAKPTFDLPSGTITKDQIHLSCTTPGADIYYTIDGSEPTPESLKYSDSISITQSPMTIKAKAFLADWDNSPTATATYYVSKIAPPTFSVAGGVYSTARSITIKSNVIGATIYYTIDGADPTPPSAGVPANGKKFTTAISITKDCVLKAIAYKYGLNTSEVATVKYCIGATPAPKFSLVSDRTYNQGDTLTLSDTEPTALIYFTTDGSTPTEQSALYDQDHPIELTRNVTVKAKAYSPIRMPSPVITATYNVTLPTPPQFNVAGGSYTNEQTVTVTCPDPDAVIRYTTNNTEPLATSPAILSGQAVQVKGPSTVLKAKSFKTGWSPSATTTATYKITTVGTVATPTLSPSGASPLPTLPYSVTVNCTTPGAVVRYTDNGTTPNGLSPVVEGGYIPLTEPKTIKVRAFKDGMASSAVVSASFTSTIPKPELSGDTTNNEQTVMIVAPAVPGATIRYTVDGTEPTAASKIAVNGQVLINKSLTLKAKAFKSGWIASPTLSKIFSITQAASPTFSVASGTYQKSQSVVVKCATVPATGKTILIHYTLDGTDPTTTSSPTCAPGATITIPATNAEKIVTLKAMAVGAGLTDSNMTTATYRMTGTVAKPTLYVISKNILQAGGTYASGLRVYARCATEGAEIHYTTDGTTPTLTSPLMTGDYILVEKSCKLNVQAFKTDWLPSPVTSETYSILQVATPAITIIGTNATVSCDTPGSVIHYTTNGNDPNESDPVATPELKIPINEGVTLKARAWKTGLIPSVIAVAKTQYTLAVTADANGSVTPATPVTVNHGIGTVIQAKSNSNYHFLRWIKTAGTGSVVFSNPKSENTTVTVIGGDVTIQATFEHDPYILTVESDGNGSVTPLGSSSVKYGSSATITAVPVAGYHFLGWVQTGGSGTAVFGNAQSEKTTVSATGGDVTVRANFIICYVLTLTNDGCGTTNPSGKVEVSNSVNQTIHAIPGEGGEFVNWTKVSGSGDVVFGNASSPDTSITLANGDATVQANFTLTPNTWVEGKLSAGESKWYRVKTTVGTKYILSCNDGYCNNGLYSCRTTQSVYHKDATTPYFGDLYYTYNNPVSVTAQEDYIYVVVHGDNSDDAGSFAIWVGPQYNLTVTANEYGDVDPSGSILVGSGMERYITAYHYGDSIFKNWTKISGSGEVVFRNANSNETYVTVTGGDATICANFEADPSITYELTIRGTANGTVTPAGKMTVHNGAKTKISAVPTKGCQFVKWVITSGFGTVKFDNEDSPETYVTVTGGDATIEAYIAKPFGPYDTWNADSLAAGDYILYHLNTVAGTENLINWDDGYNGSGNYQCQIRVSAYHKDLKKSYFKGDYYGYNDPRTINPAEDGAYILIRGMESDSSGRFAVKAGSPQVSLTVNSGGNGTTSPNSQITVKNGESRSIVATPNAGCSFVNWTQTGGTGTVTFIDSNSASTMITVTGGNAVIQANFAVDQTVTYQLTLINNGNGSTTPSGMTQVNNGVDINITATPDQHYHFTNWTKESGAGTVVFGNSNAANTTVKILSGNATIRANFALDRYNLTVISDGNGTIYPSYPMTVGYGVPQTIWATANTGCTFSHWSKVSGTGTVIFADPNAANTTVTVTDGDATIQANFSADQTLQYTLTLTTSGTGSTSPSGTVTVNNGVGITLNAISDENCSFINWAQTAGTGRVVFANPNSPETTATVYSGNVTVQANFLAPVSLFGTWIPGNIVSQQDQWYYFKATPGKTYKIFWADNYSLTGSYTCYTTVSAFHKDKTSAYFSREISANYSPETITATDDLVYILVDGNSSYSGTYAIRVDEIN